MFMKYCHDSEPTYEFYVIIGNEVYSSFHIVCDNSNVQWFIINQPMA